jgi:hypothetical protein
MIAQAIRSRWASLGCLVIVVASFFLPPDGGGLPICQFRNVTHLPCLGCGLTRSFIRMAHLDFAQAAFWNPTSLLLFPLVLLIALLLPLPLDRRELLARWVEGQRRLVVGYGSVMATVFIGYGVGRLVWLLWSGRPSPW